MAKTPAKIKKLCPQLIEHMSKGYSFNSFTKVCRIPSSTLLDWADKYPKFGKAKAIAEAEALHYWETVGILATQGGLQRVKTEVVKQTTLYDEAGRELKDEHGQAVKEQVLEREYERIPLREGMWKFVMASRFKKAGYVVEEDPGKLPDPEGPAQKVKSFQLAYALGDQPYVVKSKEAEHGEGGDRGADQGSGAQGGEAGDAGLGDQGAAVGAGAPSAADQHDRVELRGGQDPAAPVPPADRRQDPGAPGASPGDPGGAGERAQSAPPPPGSRA